MADASSASMFSGFITSGNAGAAVHSVLEGGGSEKVLNLKQLLHFSGLSGDAEW